MARTKKNTKTNAGVAPVVDNALAAREFDPVTPTEFAENENLIYQLYSLTDRSQPDVRDGLKRGAQRLLFWMFDAGVTPDAKPRKSGHICNSVTGLLHPHSADAMYGTLTTHAAPYARVRLIEGVGAFGMTPGATPAADRYTEARLSPEGFEVVRDIAAGGVPMRPSYGGDVEEPLYLPARFPVLLCVGAEGIGEGWATKTPAHNPREVMTAARALLDNPDMTVDELLEIMPGPDWGTGGRVVGSAEGIRDYYETGRGRLTVRARHHIEGRNIFFTEVPAGVSVPTLLYGTDKQAGIRDSAKQGLIPGIADVADLSDMDSGLNIRVTVKRGHSPEDVAAALFQSTELETTFAASITALSPDAVPQWWSVLDVLREFLRMRDDVVLRRSRARLDKIDSQLHSRRGQAAVALHKEKVARIVLDANDRDDAIAALTAYDFELTADDAARFDTSETTYRLDADQAKAVVSMPVQRLTKSDAAKALAELDALIAERDRLRLLVDSSDARAEVIDAELAETAAIFDDPQYDRLTSLEHDEAPTGGPAELTDAERLALWKLDTEMGVLGEEGVGLDESSLVWAITRDGKVKLFGGGGLPKNISPKPLIPDVDNILSCGVVGPDEHLFFVTRGTNKSSTARLLRVDPAAVPVQGIAGSGVVGIRIEDTDEIVAGFTAAPGENVFLMSESGWKVVEVNDDDLPVKGRGAQGVGVFKLTAKDTDGVVLVEKGKGFVVNGAPAAVTSRSRAPQRERVNTWETSD